MVLYPICCLGKVNFNLSATSHPTEGYGSIPRLRGYKKKQSIDKYMNIFGSKYVYFKIPYIF